MWERRKAQGTPVKTVKCLKDLLLKMEKDGLSTNGTTKKFDFLPLTQQLPKNKPSPFPSQNRGKPLSTAPRLLQFYSNMPARACHTSLFPFGAFHDYAIISLLHYCSNVTFLFPILRTTQTTFSTTSRFSVQGHSYILQFLLSLTKIAMLCNSLSMGAQSLHSSGRTPTNTTHQLFLQCTISHRCVSPGRQSPPPGCSDWAPEMAEAPPQRPPGHVKTCQGRQKRSQIYLTGKGFKYKPLPS